MPYMSVNRWLFIHKGTIQVGFRGAVYLIFIYSVEFEKSSQNFSKKFFETFI